jgi:hypothetical protein
MDLNMNHDEVATWLLFFQAATAGGFDHPDKVRANHLNDK